MGSCLFSPLDKNKKEYKALSKYRKELGTSMGTKAFLQALSPTFQERHRAELEIDSQEVATYETAIKTSSMKELVGFQTMKEKLEKDNGFTAVANTSDNFRMLVNQAKSFNDTYSDYIAYTEVIDNKLRNTVHKRDNASVETFNNQYGSMVLNDRLLRIFEPLGLKISDLYEAEKGYSGITDFANAKIIAGEFVDLIRVANSISGQLALSEEMSHLIVRMFRDKPNMRRLLSAFAANQGAMEAVLGDDYNMYVDKYTYDNGEVNYEPIAEEAVGRLLQGKLQEEAIKETGGSYLSNLWNRLISYIKKTFKDYRASDVEQALIDADQTLGTLAKNILKGSVEITREDIESTITPDVEAEMQKIKEQAIANGTFMKAPNGRPTNLTERQWLQVRTKNFINWFGDWLSFNKSNPYSKDISLGDLENDFSNVDASGISKVIPIYLNGKWIGEFGFNNKLEDNSQYLDMPSVGGNNVSIEEEYRGKGYGKAAYFEIAKLAANNGKILRSAPDASRTPASTRVWESLVRDGYAKKVGDRYEFINSSLNDASKVVDENGEPLVVYHGSKTEVTIFDSSKSDARYRLSETIKPTNFFSDDSTVANAFAKTEKQSIANAIAASFNELEEAQVEDENEVWNHVANSVNKSVDWVKNFWLNELSLEERMDASDGIMYDPNVENQKYQVFLNLRNPIIIDAKGERADKVLEENKDVINNNDEVIILNIDETVGKQETATDYLVRNPNQIKSATDNNGEFSKTNPDMMYHLEKDMKYLEDIIEDAIATETKKTKIIKQEKAIERAQKKLDNLNAIINETPEGQLKGIINYAHNAVNDLGAARESLGRLKGDEANFAALRGIRSTIQSYDNFIKQLGDLINSEDEELSKLIQDTSIEDKNHVEVTLKSAYDNLSSLHDLVKSRFAEVALDSVEEFFKPFFGVEGKFTDGQGNEKSLRELIEEASSDIGFADRYLMTMSSSGDLLLQLFDEVVQKAKADARYKTIDDLNDIMRLMLDAEEMGITEFDWMYEKDKDGHKTGNYLSAVNKGQYDKDRREFFEELDKEYGINPSGAAAKEKLAKRREWLSAHGRLKPNSDIYSNSDFNNLSSKQKDILNRYMQLKQKFDKRLPSNKTSLTRAIQMRRTSQQRLLNSLSDPEQVFKNIQESLAKDFTVVSDDDTRYGEKTGLKSFDGSEFKVLPAVYTRRLSNPDELTSDVFSALAAYSYSTNVYEEMDKVVDPLEVAKAYVNEYRKTKATANGRELVEKIVGKNEIINPIFKTGASNISAKLEDFMDTQVYGRYYADSDKTINVMGVEIKSNKVIDKWLSVSSMVQLGFNALSHLGNVSTGVAMQNIEALCGHYFTAKQLFHADGKYLAALKDFLPELESKNPKSKLALFDQLFDIKQEFAGNTQRRMNTLFEKLFGKTVAYLGQNCGDHWLYNRTAIAMCLNKKVKLSDGTVTTLWDALKVVDAFEGDSRIKKLTIDAVDAETGEVIDKEYIRQYSEKINKINHRLFGVYNTDDMVAAQRVALGRCMLQYRQWMIPMFARRFQSRKYIIALGEYEEGYYRTLMHVVAGLRGGLHGVAEVWDELDEPQKRNVFRAITEMSQFALIWMIANFVSFGKGDPDRVYAMKLAEYMAQRELHELGNLTPSFTMGNEILKTVKSPASILNTTQAALNLFASLLDPRDWNDEIESGKYEGMSTLHKNILKAPFPILAPFNQLDRFTDSIEEVTRYYARPQ